MKAIKTFDDVNERIEELYNDLVSGKRKHYEVKEAANLVGKHIGNVKNKLVYGSMWKRPEMHDYFGMSGAAALTKR